MKDMLRVAWIPILIVGGLWFAWEWGFCRFYVPPNCMAVVTAKAGKPLPPGRILAGKGQKGVQEDVLGEGRYFLNPWLFEHEIRPVVTIPPGKVGLVTAKVGEDLPEGEFLAAPGQKGIWRNVLGPGKYRLNPCGYEIETVDAISIPVGYVGVLTSLSGKPAPEGQFAGPGEKGVRADVLQPGLYYANPKQYKIDVLEIGVNQVSLLGRLGGAVLTKTIPMQVDGEAQGVQMLQQNALMAQKKARDDYVEKSSLFSNQARRAPAQAAAQQQQRMQAPNAQAEQQQAAPEPFGPQGGGHAASPSFVLNQFVEFPSRDGFEINLDITVEFELLPERIASIFRSYGDLPAVMETAIMPQILSISRLKGSAYKATDFIVGEGRLKFQTDLTQELQRALEERQIKVHNALIRHVGVPDQILTPIQQASLATEQDLTNKERQNTAKKQAELNTETSMIEQKSQEVQQETEKLCAEVKADQEKEVAELGATTLKQVAEIDNETAGVRALQTLQMGQAKARSVLLVEGEKARGFQLKAQAFGDPQAYTLAEFARGLNPSLRINVIHAGEGTLWTDLQKAGLGDLGGAQLLQSGQKK